MKTFNGFLSTVLTILLLLSSVAIATPDAQPRGILGHRVRINAPRISPKALVGQVVAIGRDTLSIKGYLPDSSWSAIPISAITKLDLHSGRRSYTLIGALVGAGAGLATFGILKAIDSKNESKGFGGLNRNLERATAAVLIGGGSLIGGVIGTFTHSDRWQEIPLDQFSFATVLGVDGRVGLELILRF